MSLKATPKSSAFPQLPEITADDCQIHRSSLPGAVTAKFGTMGFCKWTNCYLPILVVDPMQLVLEGFLPEGTYRAWLFKFAALTILEGDAVEGELLDKVPLLIFWYGTTYEFSIVRMGDVMSWEEGTRKGYDAVPEFIATRSKLKEPRPQLTMYALLEAALQDLEGKALSLAPEERSLAVFASSSAKKPTSKSRKKNKKQQKKVVLNEWHALALDHPPHVDVWKEKQEKIQTYLSSPSAPSSFRYFGEIAYLPRTCGTLEYLHPVLILGPFRVPPGDLRDRWFTKCSSGDLVMVYWLGYFTSRGGEYPDSAYSFHGLDELQFPKKTTAGQEEPMLNVEPPASILQKYNLGITTPTKAVVAGGILNRKGKSIFYAVDLWVCGVHWELPQALERAPHDRWAGMEDFEEDYQDDFESFWEFLDGAKGTRRAISNSSPKKQGRKKSSSVHDQADTTPATSSKPSELTTDPNHTKPGGFSTSFQESSENQLTREIRALATALEDDLEDAAKLDTKRKTDPMVTIATSPSVEPDAKRSKI